jgi:ATP-dependent helicase/DNAse subunit B
MTIDFHPSAQELQDQERYRIKQYSVTLPPMNETNYKSHAELLDELVVGHTVELILSYSQNV